MDDLDPSPELVDVSDDEIKEELQLVGSQSPTPTILQSGGRGDLSPTKGEIRLRPLKALIVETSPTVIGDGDDEGNIEEMNVSSTDRNNWPNVEITNIRNDPNWRSKCRGIRRKLKFVLDHDDSYQDVTFVVGKNGQERISGHKLILRIGSPVMDRLFQTREGSSDGPVEIPLIEVEPFAFRHLLKYLYTDEFSPGGLRSTDIMAVLQGAKFFEVYDLVHDCVQALKDNVTDENAVGLCELARDIDDLELSEIANSYICEHAEKVLTGPSLFELTYSNFLLLIDNDNLKLEEHDIFTIAYDWGEDQCKKQNLEPTPASIKKVLNEIVYKVRYPIMSSDAFADEVVNSKILTSEEQVLMFKYFCLSESKRGQLDLTPFISKRRNHTKIKSEPSVKDEKDLKIEASNSPCSNQPTLASNLNEITETESEDACSFVSSVKSHGSSSFTPSKKRPRIRSPSPTHSKALKASKIPPSSLSKTEKSRTTRKSIDPEKQITLKGCEIEFNEFIRECCRNPRRKEIESIRLSGVKVTDHNKLQQDLRVKLPKLKEFHLDIIIPNMKHSSVNILAGELVLEDFLFFGMKVGGASWKLENIWSLGVNISLVINGITMIKINHNQKQLIINKLRDVNKILQSTRGDVGVRGLVLSHQKFPDHADLFPSQYLERLVLLSISHIPEVSKFLKKFKRLRELCLLTTELKKIDLCNDLVSEKLKKLAVGTAKFSIPLPAALKSLEELFLWRCEWTPGFEDSFHMLFPNLKKVSFFGSKTSPKLLKKILKIRSIEEIGCGMFDWTNADPEEIDEMKNIVLLAGLSENERSFVLTKIEDEDPTCWEGKKGSLDLSQEEIYRNFQFNQVYQSYDTFRS